MNLINQVLHYEDKIGYVAEEKNFTGQRVVLVFFQNYEFADFNDLYEQKYFKEGTPEFVELLKGVDPTIRRMKVQNFLDVLTDMKVVSMKELRERLTDRDFVREIIRLATIRNIILLDLNHFDFMSFKNKNVA